MKKFFYTILTSLVFLPAMAVAGNGNPIKIMGTSLEITVPENYTFLDSEATLDYLETLHYISEDSSHVVGLLAPDSILQKGSDRLWIIEYREGVGHVKDDRAPYMDFNGLLHALNQKHATPGNWMKWGWKPSHDLAHHVMTLPFLYLSPNDTTLESRQWFFGRDGMATVIGLGNLDEVKWHRDNASVPIEAISFVEGHRYEDFNPEEEPLAYQSVSAFIQGIRNTGDGSAPGGMAEGKKSGFLLPFEKGLLKWLAMIGGLILLAIGTLMVMVYVSSKRDESSEDINRLSRNVVLRVGVFALVYLFLLLFGVFLLWAAVRFCWVAGGIFGIIAIWIAVLSYFSALIGSIWAISSSSFSAEGKIEVTKAMAPDLFTLISETATALHQPLPAKVYLAPDANASVAFENPLRSILGKSGKILTIGMPLLTDTSREELKAIIAHEYGHFTQGSMRMQPIVGVAMQIAAHIDEKQGQRFLGKLLQPLLRILARYLRRGLQSLSRAMEFGADETSTRIVGSRMAVSALYKSELITTRFDDYWSVMTSAYSEDKVVPDDFYGGFRWFCEMVNKLNEVEITYDLVAENQLQEIFSSRVKVKNPWESHPPMDKRIANIRRCAIAGSEIPVIPASDLLPAYVIKQMGIKVLEDASMTDGKPCDKDEYMAVMERVYNEHTFPRYQAAIMQLGLPLVDPAEFEALPVAEAPQIEDVFNDRTRRLAGEYHVAVSDYHLLMAFRDGKVKEKEIQYDGAVYRRKNVPVETHREYVASLFEQVRQVTKNLEWLALSKAPDRALVRRAFDDINYSIRVKDHIRENILPVRDRIVGMTRSGGELSKEQFKILQGRLLELQNLLVSFMNGVIDLSRLDPVMNVNMPSTLRQIESPDLLTDDFIAGTTLNYVFTWPDEMLGLFDALEYYAKKIVSDTIEGREPLMYWKNTVAERIAEENAANEERV